MRGNPVCDMLVSFCNMPQTDANLCTQTAEAITTTASTSDTAHDLLVLEIPRSHYNTM